MYLSFLRPRKRDPFRARMPGATRIGVSPPARQTQASELPRTMFAEGWLVRPSRVALGGLSAPGF
jgi:hypothetical protein